MFCLTPQAIKMMKDKFLSGEITPEKLNNAKSSEERRAMLSFLGADTALKVNELIESKLLLKNQQKGLITAAKHLFGEKTPAARDAVSSILRMGKFLHPEDKNKFMSDLAAKRLGTKVSQDQAEKIFNAAKIANDARSAIPKTSPNGSPERVAFGNALVSFKDYMKQVRQEDHKIPLKDLITDPLEMFTRLSGLSKSLVANLNIHYFGRQGWRTLFDRPSVWLNGFGKTFGDIASELKGMDAMAPIKAEIWSRENALNGLYTIHKVDIGLDSEEAFPEHLPGKIPLIGKLFKASESSFNGAALRLRADTFDALVKEAKEKGVDVTDPKTNLGTLANSITARGQVNLPGKVGRFINASMFSPKYLKSELDALGALPSYVLNKVGLGKGDKAGEFARAKNAQNVIKTVAGVATIMTIAKLLDPDSVKDIDPRSAKFGKIYVGADHEIGIDVTAGMGSLVTAVSRLIPTEHEGKLGFWYKKYNGSYVDLLKNRNETVGDVISDFFTNRASPLMGFILSEYINHKYYDKESVGDKALKLVEPMQTTSVQELNKDTTKVDSLLYGLLLAGGFMGAHESVDYKHQ